ncbi:MAG: phospholipase C, phosphocholine-specific [Puia sp.]|nr:phospholipase C, phosphocholine-specific [Puia sp.]
MDNRRDFLKKAALLAGGAGFNGVLPPAIQKALAIDPKFGSTYLDAEHVVLLMQENRSFDHCFGALRGVRGFNDPRAITLPNKNRVWLQTDESGDTYTPFPINIRETKATWLGGLPHSWTNQVDAGNGGKHDKWLEAKKTGNKEIFHSPWTMGHYTREDLPFYYALADSFTVCDQNFCSSLTGTTPNRLFFWTGTIREEQNMVSRANVLNDNVDYPTPAKWDTFPERLEENGISWKIYQNEISLDSGLEGEHDAWLANFTDNPIEWFTQYNVKFSASYRNYLKKLLVSLPGDIKRLEEKVANPSLTAKQKEELEKELQEKKTWLKTAHEDLQQYTPENFEKLSEKEKNLHRKAFAINSKDPNYRELDTYQYHDGDTTREMLAPKGDVLHQFREDVKNGQLPTVSWLVAPENFSDHAGAPWYGAWYVSEVMDILTENPEVWKKTIFILTYDENDGLFDHIPPFNPPYHPGTGLVSEGIDTSVEHVSIEEEMKYKPREESRDSSIGLGFRVPMIVASPWSRGGCVNSEVFDHTSSLQFLEKFLQAKTGKPVKNTNISTWRRTVCGDLTSTFKPWNNEKVPLPAFLVKDAMLERVYNAKFKKVPTFKKLTDEEIAQVNLDPTTATAMPVQEKGIRPSNALPYQLYAEGNISADKNHFSIRFAAGNDFFGKASAGSPFKVYAPGSHAAFDKELHPSGFEQARSWAYAVSAGDQLTDTWSLSDFENGQYHLRVYGPNGFFREYSGNAADPRVEVVCEYQHTGKTPTGRIELTLSNLDAGQARTVVIQDNAYKSGSQTKLLAPAGSPGSQAKLILDLSHSHHWYDFSVRVKGADTFEKRYAGRVETGREGFSDPLMGRV